MRSRSRFLAALCRAILPLGALLLAFAAPAYAARGAVTGTEMPNYARVIFSFDTIVGAKVRVVNSVLLIEFDEAVTVDLDKIAQQIPSYVSVARIDPDQRSIRFAMNDRFRADVKLAGERVYVDILAPRWQGLPPALPQEVVQDLVKRARIAEELARKASRDTEKTVERVIDIRLGSAPTFRRAVFVMSKAAPVQFEDQEGKLSLTFEGRFALSETLLKQRLAGLANEIEIERAEDQLKIVMRSRPGLKVRGFREDDTFALDFQREDGKPIEAADVGDADTKTKADAPRQAPSEPVKQADVSPKVSVSPEVGRPGVPPPVTSAELARPAPGSQQPIDLVLEPAKDSAGFVLRLARLKDNPIAVVPRANGLTIVIETNELPGPPVIPQGLRSRIESLSVSRVPGGALIQITPTEPGGYQLVKAGEDLLIERGRNEGDAAGFAGGTIPIKRGFDRTGKEALLAMVGEGGKLFVVDDPSTGQKLSVVPVAQAGLSMPKALSFAEFSIERTLAGLAVLPVDEAVSITRVADAVMVSHDIRLNLSAMPAEAIQPNAQKQKRALLVDPETWDRDANTPFRLAERNAVRAAAETPRVNRTQVRLRLARLYLANGYYPEAQGVLEVLAADDTPAAQTKVILYHRALAALQMGRLIEAGRFLQEPALADEPEQKLLQAVLDAKLMRPALAVANFKQVGDEITRYPDRLQADFRRVAIEAATEADEPVLAKEHLLAFEQIDQRFRNPHQLQLLAGRLAEQQGRFEDAVAAYNLAAQSRDRRIEAEARYGKTTAGIAFGNVSVEDAKVEFETLTAIWRRSEVEVKSLAKLGEMYAGDGRWREAFLASQRATSLMPEHPVARRLEEAMGRRFENIFLDAEGHKVSKVEALALYQEFRQLVPPGRRGDEIARRLADRLFDLDLVDEAADILEHQVKKRLDGVARSVVATRLAVMQLQNRKPEKALAILRETRLASMPPELRRARGLLEARALGDLFRTELAVELLANETGEDVNRLRADIYWKGKAWREAGEGYERVLGDHWQGKDALNDTQRLDAMRAALAYALADEKLATDRLRSKFLPKMARSEDAVPFNVLTQGAAANPQAFRNVARTIVNADTMTDFLAAYRKRYPETGGESRPVRSAGDQQRQSAVETPAPGRS